MTFTGVLLWSASCCTLLLAASIDHIDSSGTKDLTHGHKHPLRHDRHIAHDFEDSVEPLKSHKSRRNEGESESFWRLGKREVKMDEMPQRPGNQVDNHRPLKRDKVGPWIDVPMNETDTEILDDENPPRSLTGPDDILVKQSNTDSESSIDSRKWEDFSVSESSEGVDDWTNHTTSSEEVEAGNRRPKPKRTSNGRTSSNSSRHAIKDGKKHGISAQHQTDNHQEQVKNRSPADSQPYVDDSGTNIVLSDIGRGGGLDAVKNNMVDLTNQGIRVGIDTKTVVDERQIDLGPDEDAANSSDISGHITSNGNAAYNPVITRIDAGVGENPLFSGRVNADMNGMDDFFTFMQKKNEQAGPLEVVDNDLPEEPPSNQVGLIPSKDGTSLVNTNTNTNGRDKANLLSEFKKDEDPKTNGLLGIFKKPKTNSNSFNIFGGIPSDNLKNIFQNVKQDMESDEKGEPGKNAGLGSILNPFAGKNNNNFNPFNLPNIFNPNNNPFKLPEIGSPIGLPATPNNGQPNNSNNLFGLPNPFEPGRKSPFELPNPFNANKNGLPTNPFGNPLKNPLGLPEPPSAAKNPLQEFFEKIFGPRPNNNNNNNNPLGLPPVVSGGQRPGFSFSFNL